MSTENNIILITNNNEISDVLRPKLVLLREVDNILVTSYENALVDIKNELPEAVLLYCDNDKNTCLDLIKTIKSNEQIKNTSILLVLKEYNQDFILSAYDENITDYFLINADDAEILIRTIWGLKKNALIKTVKKQRSLLERLNIINHQTRFYTEEYCEKVFENEFEAAKEFDMESLLMLVSPTEESKAFVDSNQFAESIKKSTRTSDVIAHAATNRFYIFLPQTPLKGAFCVWDKIKRAMGENFATMASVVSIEKNPFSQLKVRLLNGLIEAETTKTDFVIVGDEQEKTSNDWLDRINSKQKNFKLFKQAFSKKLDKVIAPVFFQVQKLYEEKLFNSKIEQYSNETLSCFSLQKDNHISEFKITYPGFAKINIDVIHQGLDSPENRRISLDLTDLDESKLIKLLDDFILEFKNSTEKH